MTNFRLPGVYRPQADTRLLTDMIATAGLPAGGRVLDLCAGTGVLGRTAARALRAELTAVDLSRRALLSTWLGCRAQRVPVRLIRGDVEVVRGLPRFDVIVTNPPYVPAPRRIGRGRALAWDAGPDGRSVLDRLCLLVPELLAARGVALIVQSAISDPGRTVTTLRAAGTTASVVATAAVPFGPVLRARAPWLAARGLIVPEQTLEELVVIRAERIPSDRLETVP